MLIFPGLRIFAIISRLPGITYHCPSFFASPFPRFFTGFLLNIAGDGCISAEQDYKTGDRRSGCAADGSEPYSETCPPEKTGLRIYREASSIIKPTQRAAVPTNGFRESFLSIRSVFQNWRTASFFSDPMHRVFVLTGIPPGLRATFNLFRSGLLGRRD